MNRGAVFRKADLHLHAPGTGQNFTIGRSTDVTTPEERAAFAREYVRRAREAGLDIIAITNHNDTSWIAPIREAAQELYGDTLVVFPGVEVGSEAGESIHILAIFDLDTDVSRIEWFLEEIGLPCGERFMPNGDVCPAKKSFTDIVSILTEKYGGIPIAAHAFSCENSLLGAKENRGLSRQNQFRHPKLLGLDIHDKGRLDDLTEWQRFVVTNTHHDPGFRRERPIACLSSSDARSLEEIGDWYTWIKCEEVNLESLSQALRDHEARLRLRDDPPPEPPFVISSVTVGDTPTGFLRGLRLELNERMNCLIGGRGTGKSAIIELLRYVWEQDPMPRRREETEAFLPVFFPETARVTVDLVSTSLAGQKVLYRLKREGRVSSQVYLLENEEEILQPDLSPRHLFHLDVYGQKEVLYTSEDVRSQLELLDRMVGEPVEQLNQGERETLLRLGHNREQIIALQRQIEQLQGRLDQLPAIRRRLEEIYATGVGEQAEVREQYEREKGLWQTTLERLDEVIASLQRGARVRLDLGHLAKETISQLPSADNLAALRTALAALQSRIDKGLDRVLADVQAVRQQVESGQGTWKVIYQEFEKKYRQQLAALDLGPDFQPDEILRLEEDRTTLEQLESEVEEIQKQVHRLLEQRNKDLEHLQDVRQRRFEERARKADEITARLHPQQADISPRVRVRVSQAGDREAVIEQLKMALSGSRLRERDYQAMAGKMGGDILGMLACIEQADVNVEAVMRAFTQWAPDTSEPQPSLGIAPVDPLQDLAESLDLDHPNKAGKVIEYLGWEQRLELAEFGIPDEVTVEVNIARAGKPIWRPLGHRIGEGVSVGQGCTAILSIILLEARNPLIIDQPEDDLDNRFIYGEVVQILRRERGQRQMIIATHNPNIPVAGDAELIVALSTEETEYRGRRDLRCKIEAQGFIDNPVMRQQVSQILEGGEQAFELRRQKYGF